VEKLYLEQALDPELSLEKARDILWTLTSREIYRLLVLERKWKVEEYQNYLGKILKSSLLKEQPHSESS
jgi:hypothetical protein